MKNCGMKSIGLSGTRATSLAARNSPQSCDEMQSDCSCSKSADQLNPRLKLQFILFRCYESLERLGGWIFAADDVVDDVVDVSIEI